jgi:hypothetical protein
MHVPLAAHREVPGMTQRSQHAAPWKKEEKKKKSALAMCRHQTS